MNKLFNIYRTGGWEDALKTVTVFRVFIVERGKSAPSEQLRPAQRPH